MLKFMKLGIYALQKVLYQGEAFSVNCKTTSGEITILDHHLPLISILEKGTVKVVDKEKQEHYIPVSAGFLEMRSGNELRILADQGKR